MLIFKEDDWWTKTEKENQQLGKWGDTWIKSTMNLAKNVAGLNKQELIMTVKPSHQAKQKSVELVSAQ